MYVPQVFKTNKGGWSKVLNMRNMTDSGQPCSSNVTEPCRKLIHNVYTHDIDKIKHLSVFSASNVTEPCRELQARIKSYFGFARPSEYVHVIQDSDELAFHARHQMRTLSMKLVEGLSSPPSCNCSATSWQLLLLTLNLKLFTI
jgi:hypothetical protein